MNDAITSGYTRRRDLRCAGGHLLLPALAALGVALIPALAGATGGAIATALGGSNNIIETILCQLVGVLEGPTGKAIAMVAVGGFGIGALMAKVSWQAAAAVAAGIAILMGAGSVVTAFGGNNDACIFSDINAPDFICLLGAPVPPTANMFANSAVNSGDAEDTASGGAFTGNNACDNATTGIFAHVLCYFKSTIGQVMTAMYCALQFELIGPLGAVITLVIVLFGIAIITGIAQVNIKEAGWLLFKLALVWAFVMNSTWAIGIAYKFFMGLAEEGSDIVLTALTANGDPGGDAPTITQPDTVLKNMFGFLTGTGGNLAGVDPQVQTQCGASLGVLIALLSVFLPIVPAFILIMAMQYLALYARAMLGYLTAIVLIAFLFILSPIFISFALFKTTLPLFQQWISFLTSFALQVIVIFGFLALLGLVLGPITDFFVHLMNLMRAYDKMMNIWVFNIPYKMCGICQYAIDQAAGTIQCTGEAPADPPTAGFLPSADGQTNVIPLSNLMMHQDLVIYVVGHVVAFWLIAKILQAFLQNAPELARQLGGAPIATSLGGASPEAASVGAGNISYIGMESLQAGMQGFKNGMMANPLDPTSTLPRRLLSGLGAGASSFLYGAPDENAGDPDTQAKVLRAEQREAAVQKEYQQAQARTTTAYDAQQAALEAVRNTSPTLQPAEYAAALKKLQESRDAYVAASGNEPIVRQRLLAAKTSVESLGATPRLGGILSGSSPYGSSLIKGASGHADDDQVLGDMVRDKREAQGGRGDAPDKGSYFGMRLGGDAGASSSKSMDALRGEASNRLSNIQRGMDASRLVLPPERVKKIEAAISAAQSELANAKTERSYQAIIDKLESIQSSLT